MEGIILKAISGFYYVEADNTLYECKARGIFRKDELTPKVGDKVTFTPDGEKGIVEAVHKRKTELDRPALANIDKLFIVSSYQTPAPNTLLIDRLAAMAVYKGIKPIIVFNKSDMGDFTTFETIYKNAGFDVAVVSAKTGEGIEKIQKMLEDSISAFCGNSGVGKSSLLNTLFPDLSLATGEVSQKLGRGRHTTRHTQLFAHSFSGYVADTPGFSSLETVSDIIGFKNNLIECFPDLARYSNGCKFADCSHTKEKGCMVCEALKNGKIEPTRHQSYVTLFNELKDVKEWNIKNSK